MTHPIGFGFEHVVLHHGDPRTERIRDASGTLLYDVLEFMAKKKLSMGRMWAVLTGSKMNLRAPGKRQGPDGRGIRTNMNAHVREVGAECAFHFGLNIARKRPSARSGLQIHLKRLDPRTLNRRLCLYRGVASRGEEMLTRVYEEPALNGRAGTGATKSRGY